MFIQGLHAPGAKGVAFTSHFKDRCVHQVVKTEGSIVCNPLCESNAMTILHTFLPKCGLFSGEIENTALWQTKNSIGMPKWDLYLFNTVLWSWIKRWIGLLHLKKKSIGSFIVTVQTMFQGLICSLNTFRLVLYAFLEQLFPDMTCCSQQGAQTSLINPFMQTAI